MTTKQRAKLRSMANTMEAILHIGKEASATTFASRPGTRWRRGN